VTSVNERPLRPGDVVEVRSAAEVLATLDGDAALDPVPFMTEMVPHAGQRYTVTRRVDKICDTIAANGTRRLHATIYLEDLRCDGSTTAGAKAGRKLYWKGAWFRRVGEDTGAVDASMGAGSLEHIVKAGIRTVLEVGGDRSYVRQYRHELANGNFGQPLFNVSCKSRQSRDLPSNGKSLMSKDS
jgi:hypothetical protein